MSISSVMSNAVHGLQSSINRTAVAGTRMRVENPEMAGAAVGMTQAAIESKASLNVIKVADELLGTLIDVRA